MTSGRRMSSSDFLQLTPPSSPDSISSTFTNPGLVQFPAHSGDSSELTPWDNFDFFNVFFGRDLQYYFTYAFQRNPIIDSLTCYEDLLNLPVFLLHAMYAIVHQSRQSFPEMLKHVYYFNYHASTIDSNTHQNLYLQVALVHMLCLDLAIHTKRKYKILLVKCQRDFRLTNFYTFPEIINLVNFEKNVQLVSFKINCRCLQSIKDKLTMSS